MSSSPDIFHGWLGHDKKAVGNMRWESFTPKPFAETDIDIKVTHCGICGTDIHTLRSGWNSTHYPACVGHEIVGHVVRRGSSPAAQRLEIGDRVGVGAQAASCLKDDCEECSSGMPQYCGKGFVGTYNGLYREHNYWSMGGYADHVRVPAHFAVKIPERLKSADAAPMLCGGITVYAPLKENGAGPGRRVGIVGLGGLGHFGVLFAKALGCDKVVAISRGRAKAKDAEALGADDFIATNEDEKWDKKHSRTLDLIISTVDSPDMPLSGYIRLLRTNGQFIQVGAPEGNLPSIPAGLLFSRGCKLGGSQIGSPKDIEEMLQFAADKGIKPWIQQRPMSEANQSVVDFEDGKARYRYVLVNDDAEHSKL